MMLTGDAIPKPWKKIFPRRKKCLRTISDELTLSEVCQLKLRRIRRFALIQSLPWLDRAHIDREEKTCPKGYAPQSGALKCALIG
ncbi:hypothetical protein ACSQ67_025443 [Phaseolus vulgaris]